MKYEIADQALFTFRAWKMNPIVKVIYHSQHVKFLFVLAFNIVEQMDKPNILVNRSC